MTRKAYKTRVLILGCLLAAVVAAVIGAVRLTGQEPPNAVQGENAAPASAAYDYGSRVVKDDAGVVRRAAEQWPESPKGEMTAMMGRLDSVVERLNSATGMHCVVRVGETGHAAVSNGDGTVTVDVSVLWRLSEDGLAALLAHEFGHEALLHGAQLARINAETSQGVPGVAARERELERAADEFAGRLASRAGYGIEGFAEILSHVNCPDWQSSLIRQYYPREQRDATFRRAYEQARSDAEAATASRPAAAARATGESR